MSETSDFLGADAPRSLVEKLLDILAEADPQEGVAALCAEYPSYSAQIRETVRQVALANQAFGLLDPSESGVPKIPGLRIVERLGKGGNGVVYRAEQLDPPRDVAVKVIDHRLLRDRPRESIARFEQEAEALARLRHTNIAQVYQVGTTEEGDPFLIMELIEGPGLTEYCDGLRLSLRERMQILRQVCAGVQHAHSRFVIHRDLKPSNILVATEDGRGVPKIIDFGLARLTEDPSRRGLESGLAVVGSLLYMSPEQAAGASSEADVRSDVYSLGAIAYELLTGQAPFGIEELTFEARAGVLRKIQEVSPPSPSTRVSESASRDARIAIRRRHSPRRLSSALRGELDSIVMQALEKDPSRRYGSVAALGEDLERYLAHLPIRAQDGRQGYRLRKFLRRNRLPVVAGSIVLSVLLGSTALVTQSIVRGRTLRSLLDLLAPLSTSNAEKARRAADQLPPPWPQNVADFDGWLEEFSDPVRAGLDGYRTALKSFLPALESEGSPEGARLITILEGLEIGIEEFRKLQRRVETDRDWARSVGRLTLEAYAEDWSRARERLLADERFAGLDLSPQPGLVPLGRDSRTGLENFHHLRSSAHVEYRPRRRSDGSWLPEEDCGILFALVPGGLVRVGAQNEDRNQPRFDALARSERETPVQEVRLDPYFLALHETTQAQWMRLAGANPSFYQPGVVAKGGQEFRLLHPAENLNWLAVAAVARRHGLRLPTEAQWEHAYRAGTNSPWYWGEEATGMEAYSNFGGQETSRVGLEIVRPEPVMEDGFVIHAAVGSLLPNKWGFHDMAGNVWEWCADFGWDHARVLRPGDGLYLPQVFEEAAAQKSRAQRGGSFINDRSYLRATSRAMPAESSTFPHYGVRFARSLDI